MVNAEKYVTARGLKREILLLISTDGETQCNRGAVLSDMYELYFGLKVQKTSKDSRKSENMAINFKGLK